MNKICWNRVCWISGEVLYGEQLEENFQKLALLAYNLYEGEWGWKNFQCELLNNQFTIKKCFCIFPNGSVVIFNGEYNLSFDLSTLTAESTIYLAIKEEKQEVKTIVSNGETINTVYWNPVLEINKTNGIPIGSCIWNGGWQINSYKGAILNFQESQIYEKLTVLITKASECFTLENDKEEKDFVFLQSLSVLIANLIVAKNLKVPKEVYNLLIQCLGSIIWKIGGTVGNFNYENHKCEELINIIINKILDCLNMVYSSSKKINWIQQNGYFISVEKINLDNEITIVCDRLESEILLRTLTICGLSFWEETKKRRTYGIEREKIAPLRFKLNLNCDFFRNGENIVCDSTINTTNIHFYIN